MGRFTEKQLTITTMVVAAIVAGLFAFLIYEDLNKVDEEEKNIENLTTQIRTADAEIAKKPARETDVIVYREIVERDSKILPDESEINDFINVIGDFEKLSGVVVTQVQGLKERPSRGKKGKVRQDAIIQIPLKLKLRGTMDQFLKFINFFESHERFVRISGFQMTGSRDADDDGMVRHEIGLELMTYQYDPKGGEVKRVEIPNYERRKQETPIQKRIRAEKPAHIDTYQMKPRINRRDPFIDPREAEIEDEGTDEDPEETHEKQRALLDSLKLEVSLLQEDVRLELKFKEDGAYMRLAAVAQAIDQRMSQLDLSLSEVLANKKITIPELKADFQEHVVAEYEAIKDKRKSSKDRRDIVVERKQVFDILTEMRGKFDKMQYREVIQTFQGFQRSVEGRPLSPDAEPLREEMVLLAQQAEVIAKFENEPLKIEGVIIDKKRTSFAIINGQILSEGESVDSEGRIMIKKISEREIEFIYQDVLIRKPLARTR